MAIRLCARSRYLPLPRRAQGIAAALACAGALLAPLATSATDDGTRTNAYDDPFLQVTTGMPGCKVPEGPLLTHEEARAEAHWRAQRGVSCYLSGRCRLSNAYLYDREIIPRVDKSIHADGRYEKTSLWVLGQRRWVWLKGCVASADQIEALVRLVRNIDDVEAVIDELSVGIAAKPKYAIEQQPVTGR